MPGKSRNDHVRLKHGHAGWRSAACRDHGADQHLMFAFDCAVARLERAELKVAIGL